jgi:hypothetical protein
MLRHLLSLRTLVTAVYWLFIGIAIWAIGSEFKRKPGETQDSGDENEDGEKPIR